MGNWNYCGDATYESSAGRVWLRAAPLGGVPEWMAKPASIRLVLGPYRYLEDAQAACADPTGAQEAHELGQRLTERELNRRLALVRDGMRRGLCVYSIAKELAKSNAMNCGAARRATKRLMEMVQTGRVASA